MAVDRRVGVDGAALYKKNRAPKGPAECCSLKLTYQGHHDGLVLLLVVRLS